MVTYAERKTDVVDRASAYIEAYERFVAWNPTTLKRQGANGMEFDYLPVQAYENFLDQTVGPENWQSRVLVGDRGVSVYLEVFGVTKSSSSSIWPTGKIGRGEDRRDNPQPNEVEKAEARAFRRAAAKHGLLRKLWEKHGDDAGADEGYHRPQQSQSRQSSAKSSTSTTQRSGGPSAPQVKLLSDLGVPGAVIDRLTGGRDGSASTLITNLLAAKREADDYEDERDDIIRREVKKVDRKLVDLLDEDEDED